MYETANDLRLPRRESNFSDEMTVRPRGGRTNPPLFPRVAFGAFLITLCFLSILEPGRQLRGIHSETLRKVRLN